jgi:hypothetical protein
MVDEGLVLIEKERSLHIGRVPITTKELFVQLAKEDFAQDYGMTLKWCLEQALEYQNMKPLIFSLIKPEQSTALPEEKPGIKTMNGREIQGGKKLNG